LVAVRAYFENVGGSESLLEIHYDATLAPGYAWIFPMRDGQANVGLGTQVNRSRRRDVNLKQILQRFIKSNRYANERLGQARIAGPLKGYPLRTQMSTVTPMADNILVAGEAAGLVNPLNGEGIGTAMLSGELAAQHTRRALELGDYTRRQLSGYAQDLKRYIGRNHFLARLLRDLIGWPGVMNRTVQRAQKDRAFAQTLFEVIVEVRPPGAIFSPGFMAKLIAG
jgi:flavin-dependent dehydrogenase